MEKTRTHIMIPTELIDAVDELVGPRGRSAFFAEAAERELSRRRLVEAASRAAGALADVDVPGWESPESASAWVRDLRRSDEERVERLHDT